MAMRVEIQLRIVGDDGTVLSNNAVLRLERADHRLAVVGLSLAEAKTLLADVQNRLVAAQASDYGFCQLSGQNHKMLRFVIVSDLQNIVVLPRKLTEPTSCARPTASLSSVLL